MNATGGGVKPTVFFGHNKPQFIGQKPSLLENRSLSQHGASHTLLYEIKVFSFSFFPVTNDPAFPGSLEWI